MDHLQTLPMGVQKLPCSFFKWYQRLFLGPNSYFSLFGIGMWRAKKTGEDCRRPVFLGSKRLSSTEMSRTSFTSFVQEMKKVDLVVDNLNFLSFKKPQVVKVS